MAGDSPLPVFGQQPPRSRIAQPDLYRYRPSSQRGMEEDFCCEERRRPVVLEDEVEGPRVEVGMTK